MPSSYIALKIESYLLPLVGELLTAATLKLQCEKIGTSVEHLTAMDLPTLVPRIEQALVVFLGKERADKVAKQILTMPM